MSFEGLLTTETWITSEKDVHSMDDALATEEVEHDDVSPAVVTGHLDVAGLPL